MTDKNLMPGPIDTAAVQRMAAHNGMQLDADRAAALVPFVQGLLEADARLAALDLGTLPAAGLPWAPFVTQPQEDGGRNHGG